MAKQEKSSSTRRILGVDTALRTTGYGIVDFSSNRLAAIDCGVIKTTQKQAFSECLRRLAGGMREIVKEYAPDMAVIEGAFYVHNVRTAMVLGSARGAVIATLAELGIEMYEYAPRRVKQAICGNGSASKEQVALIVSQELQLNIESIPNDATDALALAICHARTSTAVQGLIAPSRL